MPCFSIAIGNAKLTDVGRLVLQAVQQEALRTILLDGLQLAVAALNMGVLMGVSQRGRQGALVLAFDWGTATISESGVRVDGLDSIAQANAVAEQIQQVVNALGIELVGEYARTSLEESGAYVSSDMQTEYGRVINFSVEA